MGLAAVGVGAAVREARQPRRRVRVLREAPGPPADLGRRLADELGAFPAVSAALRGARVLLKPNLVELRPGRPVNTDPAFILAVVEALRRRGAAEVIVGEGPGHTRDTEAVLEGSGLGPLLRDEKVPFIDLNVDEPEELPTPGGLIPVARSALAADLLVSLPRLKTHHHAGVTLGAKNLFGVVPGAVWGWPKNPLHWRGLEQSVVDLWAGLRPGLVIADGRVGMMGDGPLDGAPVDHGVILMGDDAISVDAAAARLMGIDPLRLAWVRAAVARGGTAAAARIGLDGDAPVRVDYVLPPGFDGIRLRPA